MTLRRGLDGDRNRDKVRVSVRDTVSDGVRRTDRQLDRQADIQADKTQTDRWTNSPRRKERKCGRREKI